MERDRDDSAVDAAEQMSDATERVRERAWMLARSIGRVPPQQRRAAFRRVAASGAAMHGTDSPATFRATDGSGHAVLTVTGDIDFHTAPSLRQHVVDLIVQHHPLIVVDLTDVEFLDSAGLSALVGGLKRARQNGSTVRIVATRHELDQLFRVTGIYKVLPLYPSVEAAVAADVTG